MYEKAPTRLGDKVSGEALRAHPDVSTNGTLPYGSWQLLFVSLSTFWQLQLVILCGLLHVLLVILYGFLQLLLAI